MTNDHKHNQKRTMDKEAREREDLDLRVCWCGSLHRDYKGQESAKKVLSVA